MNMVCVLPASLVALALAVLAQPVSGQVRQMEIAGDAAGARTALQRAAQSAPGDAAALAEYAQFLDRYGDPAARETYALLLAAQRKSGDTRAAAATARRMAVLDLLAGRADAVSTDLDAYRALAGGPLKLNAAAAETVRWPTVMVPGPIRSFARMAALTPDARDEDVLPALARNVVTNGYRAGGSNEALEPTEYLKLVRKYLSQARELDQLAGESHTIRIENCESPAVADLLRILGFRMRGGCGSDVVLETVNAGRAFLTTDSGFPVNELEQSLRTNRAFAYDFHPTPLPVVFGPDYWLSGMKEKDRDPGGFLDTFISDPSLCRLYLGFTKLDRSTAEALRKGVPFQRLKVYAHVLDFFGGMFELRNGHAVTPGGPRSAAAWGDLAGANPENGVAFFEKLLARDDGWLASMYDALARIRGPVRDYLTEPAHMKRFYGAVRGRITSPGPARPVFRSNADMMLLTTRLRLDEDGKPHIPGSIETWKALFVNHPTGKYDAKLSKLASGWKEPDDVLEALFALCRKQVENEPLKVFMALTDLDRGRATPLAPATVDRLARSYRIYGSQYAIFADSGSLSDASIVQFLDTAEAINKLRDPLFRSDVTGSFQAAAGLWQILVRQQSIPPAKADAVFHAIVSPFAAVRGGRELFDAGRGAVRDLLAAAQAEGSTGAQERLVGLLAGAPADSEARDRIARDIGRIFEAQRLPSLDTLFEVADQMDAVAHGQKFSPASVARLTARLGEIPLLRTWLSTEEKNALAFGYYSDRHMEGERKLNLRAAIEKAGGDAEKLKEARGLLAPLLRDTLVGFNYAYYAPPGAQVLFTNPAFVRSHDFIGIQSTNAWRHTEVFGSGWPSNAGGRLVGSLSGLPYALAETEQNFLIPSQTQALIWGDLVPQMILSATIPRWWNVSPAQLHWVGLHVRYGRELLAESVFDAELRAQVMTALAAVAPPARTFEVARLVEQGDAAAASELVTPSEAFLVARDIAPRRPAASSCVLDDIGRLAAASPEQINYAQVSRAFGTPKPTLANSYQLELLNLRTFPTLMGYSSRILAESWESNTLYWAALADEMNLTPADLNVRVPEWTRMLVEHIFASHLEDWPAVLKSLRLVGDDVRRENRPGGEQKANLQTVPDR